MRLVADLVKIFRQQKLFVQELPIRGAAVSLFGNADVKLRIDIDADPLFRSVNLSHGAPVGIGNIISAAEDDQPLAVLQDLLNDGGHRVVGFLERAAEPGIAEVEDLFPDVESRQAVKLFADSTRSVSGADAAMIPTHAFVLWAAENDEIGRLIIILLAADDLAQTRIIPAAAPKKNFRVRPRRQIEYFGH